MEERQETLGSWEAVMPMEPGPAEQWRGDGDIRREIPHQKLEERTGRWINKSCSNQPQASIRRALLMGNVQDKHPDDVYMVPSGP